MTTTSPTLPAARPMRTTTARRTVAGGAQDAHASDYAELSKRIKAAGLLERRHGFYALRFVLISLAFASLATVFLLVGPSWWQLLVAVGFAVLLTQAAFIGHDAAHRQIFASGKRNEWTSRFVANLVVGLAHGWWMHKHSRHHGNPNTIGKDTDMDANAVVYTPQDAATRAGVADWFMRRQGWFFLPAMTLTGLDLHVKSVRMVLTAKDMPFRRIEGLLLAIRLIGFPVLVLLVAGPVIGAAFLTVQLLVFGFLLGGAFAPNHIGMPLIEEGRRVDYLRRQVLTSRDVSGGPLVTLAMGGLNHQIEHHLFPNMPSANLGRARRIVTAYCAELGVVHTDKSLVAAMREVVRYIHRVGLRHADPFDCPAAAALRSV